MVWGILALGHGIELRSCLPGEVSLTNKDHILVGGAHPWRGSSDCRSNKAPPALMLGSLAQIVLHVYVSLGPEGLHDLPESVLLPSVIQTLPPTPVHLLVSLFATRKVTSLLEEFADLSAVYSDCADLRITYPCLSFCQSKCISCSQCGGSRSTQPHALPPPTFCSSSTGLSPDPKHPVNSCPSTLSVCSPCLEGRIYTLSSSSTSGKSQLLQEVLFDCSNPDVCCPSAQICSGLLLSGQIFSHSWVPYAPTKPASCLTRRVGVVASIPWGSLQLTVMHVALLSIRLSSKDAQSRPGHCHPLSILQGLPREAACKRQFPSPVVAKGRSRLQLVHTVDHQFRRPGTEAHV